MANPLPIPSRVSLEKKYARLLKIEILNSSFEDLRSGLSKAVALDQVYREIKQATDAAAVRIRERTTSKGSLRKEIAKHFEEVRGYQYKRVIQTFQSALGVDIVPLLQEDGIVREFLTNKVSENVDLIKTIPPRMHDSLKARFQREFMEAPFDERRVSALLAREYRSSGYNLRRLTRDQTQKTVNGLNEIRHRQLGVDYYIWRTSEDERVRPTHQNNNGETYSWDNPPFETGNPGDDIQCRCTAEPVVTKKDKAAIKRERGVALSPISTIKRPKGGITGHVWDIADKITRETGRWAERKEVIDAIVAEGYSRVTAATQYQKWRKFNGLVKTKVKPTSIVENPYTITALKPPKPPKPPPKTFTPGSEVRKLLEENPDIRYDERIRDTLFGYDEAKWSDGKRIGLLDTKLDNDTKFNNSYTYFLRMVDEDITKKFRAPDAIITGENRSFANLFENRVYLSKKRRTGTVVHEFGHLLENDYELKKKSLSFLKQRVGPNPKIKKLRELTGSDFYRDNEYAYANSGFSNDYTAKVYPNTPNHLGWENIDLTEIISMGLEYMYLDPVRFMNTDPGFFDFIWDNVIRKTPHTRRRLTPVGI